MGTLAVRNARKGLVLTSVPTECSLDPCQTASRDASLGASDVWEVIGAEVCAGYLTSTGVGCETEISTRTPSGREAGREAALTVPTEMPVAGEQAAE